VKDKVVVITGATSGVGRAAAIELARQGATLLLVARHRGRAEDAEREIRKFSGSIAVSTFFADLSSMPEIRRVAGEILDHTPRIDVLLNNAGVVQRSRVMTVDGFETTFATNHLAYYLLTRLLLGRLQQSQPARIVNVASEAHRWCSLDFDDLQNERRYRTLATYGKSKLANLMFTYELARRLENSGLTVNALHPGWVATHLGLDDGLLSRVVSAVSNICARTPERGADTAVWLASSPEVRGMTGKYFLDRHEIQSNAASRDHEAQRRLWEMSAQMVGLKP
jgi:NAD(P)-dependent dehydrogenase (short-subunit alcohol dehydrogenase family)